MTIAADKPFVCPVLVGRDVVLGALDSLLRQAVSGKGHVMLIAGEAGVGKTRLISELQSRAKSQQLTIMHGNCFEQDRSLPYAPAIDMLRNYLASQPKDTIAALRKTAPAVLKLLPEFSDQVAKGIEPALSPENEKQRFFSGIVQFLADLSGRQPLLLVIEDLHWSDDASFELLLQLSRRLQSNPILILMTFRSNEVSTELARFLAGLNRERLSTEIQLGPLSRTDLSKAAETIFNRPLKVDFRDSLYGFTEGNPFFLEEILKSLVTKGDIFFAGGKWDWKPISDLSVPRSISDMVQQRVEKLSSRAHQVLTLAAVSGQRFDFSVLRKVMGINETELLQAIKELVSNQFVGEESADHFIFRHALTREAVYSSLLGLEKRRLHRSIAEAIESIESHSERRVEDLAYHWHTAQDWIKSLEYSRVAGEKAMRLYSPRAAIEHFTRALDAGSHIDLPPQADILRMRGTAYDTLGDFDRALADEEMALNASRAAKSSRDEWQTLINLGFLWSSRDYSRTGDYFKRSLTLARGLQDEFSIAVSLNRLGNWQANVGYPAESQASHLEALAIFEALGDEKGKAETLDLLGMANCIGGDNIQSKDYFLQAIRAFRKQGNKEGLASSLTTIALRSGVYQNDTVIPVDTETECLRDSMEALQIVRDIGWRSGESYALWQAALTYGALCEYTKALDFAREGLIIAEEIGHKQWTATSQFTLGALYTDIFAFKEAQSHLAKSIELAREVNAQLWLMAALGWLAIALASEKRPDEAKDILKKALNGASMETIGHRSAWCAAAEVELNSGYALKALDIIDKLIASRAQSETGNVVPRLWLLKAQTLMKLDRQTEVEELLLAALKSASVCEHRKSVWHIHAQLGIFYKQSQRRIEAEHAFAKARSEIDEISQKIPDGPLKQNFMSTALSMMPRAKELTAKKLAKERSGGLTQRERDVALLIAQGLSNHAIGEKLIVTERTVETHVANILGKLRLNSRAQIAAWSASRGLSEK